MGKGEYAKVIINISHESVDRPFTYAIPDKIRDSVTVGAQVSVPFGSGNTLKKGIVVEITDTVDFDKSKIKEIAEISDRDLSLSDQRIELAAWMKRNYGSTMIAALKTVLPVKTKVKNVVKKTIVLNVTNEILDEYIETAIKKRNAAQLRLLFALKEDSEIPKSLIDEKLHVGPQAIKKLEELGIIRVEEERVLRTRQNDTVRDINKPVLSDEQSEIVRSFNDDFDKGIHTPYLIHGITGSGKTEVYMELCESVLNRGRQVIILIPEIALTFQTVMRFYNRFGNRVGVMNSTLSQGEKYELFEQAELGNIDIVVGPRSALFTPFKSLGLVVIDEEHEGTYKSENMPKYHARETAIELARMNKATVVLGSATPSVDSFYKAEKGEYRLFSLSKRLTGNQLPNVIVSDLRKELREGNRSMLSRELTTLMTDRLQKKEQVMLFINRRGVAGFVSCRACGYVVKCPHCDVSLSLHKNGRMMCHYCGYTMNAYTKCPECGSKYILGFKAGTEQVEDYVKSAFPGVKTLRMDADTTKKKDDYEDILSSFLNKEADVLIGTQMIVKGHDFKNVTLVGVLAADMSLFASDYKAPEKTFQLLTQAAGRAGRGDKPGTVVIQTYQPEHYAIQHSINQDYNGFYEEEVGYRELMDYPPAAHMLSVLVTGENETAAGDLAKKLVEHVKECTKKLVIGPAPATVSKINDIYRFAFYIKDSDYNILIGIKDLIESVLSERKNFKENVFFDFDPQNMV